LRGSYSEVRANSSFCEPAEIGAAPAGAATCPRPLKKFCLWPQGGWNDNCLSPVDSTAYCDCVAGLPGAQELIDETAIRMTLHV